MQSVGAGYVRLEGDEPAQRAALLALRDELASPKIGGTMVALGCSAAVKAASTSGDRPPTRASAHGARQAALRSGRDFEPATLPRGNLMATVDGMSHAPIFDDHNPPAAELFKKCVHCGFCLPTCPTYALWGEEMDSPRGRIHLMKIGAEGKANLTDSFVKHFDRCLGCMACMTACPSGVRYDRLIEATRAQIERHHRRSPGEVLHRKWIFNLFPFPRRLRAARLPAWAYQDFGPAGTAESHRPGEAPAAQAALDGSTAAVALTLRQLRAHLSPERIPAQGAVRKRCRHY